MKVHEKIRSLRTSRGWTQETFADMLGMSTNGYANIERGDTDLGLQRLEQIAKLFEMSYLDILNMNEKSGFYFYANNNTNTTNCQIQSDQAVAHQLDKVQQENQFLKEKNAFLERENQNLQEIVALLNKKTTSK